MSISKKHQGHCKGHQKVQGQTSYL